MDDHGVLPWTPKVVPLGLGTPFRSPLQEYKGHIKGNLKGYNLGGAVASFRAKWRPRPSTAKLRRSSRHRRV